MKLLNKLQIVHSSEEWDKCIKEMIPCKCSICGEEPAIYRRRLSLNMIRVLVYLKKYDPNYLGLHLQKELAKISIVAPAMDYIQLKRWSFIEPILEVENNIPVFKNGYYKLTYVGNEFLYNRLAVKEEVLVYKNETILFEGNSVYCKDIVNNHNVKYVNILKEWNL